jgi:hypothetical protein
MAMFISNISGIGLMSFSGYCDVSAVDWGIGLMHQFSQYHL